VRRLVVLTALIAVLALTPSAAAGSQRYVVQGDTVLAGYAVKRDGTLRGAIERFGPGQRRLVAGGSICRARWPGIGLTITFYNLGGQNPCTPRFGFFGRAIVTGARWRTAKGLAIGDPVARLRRLFPEARHRGVDGFRGYWLVVRTTQAAGTYPGLLARVRDGRVVQFRVHYQAGGE
jgi:hypothetical protein